MDKSRKINASAGKGMRYRPGATSAEFGQPNMVGKGAGISANAKIRSQAHSRGSASGMAPTDKSSVPPMTRKAPMAPGPAGNASPEGSLMGVSTRVTQLPPGDLPRRRQ